MMRTLRALTLIALLAVAGCGKVGSLELPPEDEPEDAVAAGGASR